MARKRSRLSLYELMGSGPRERVEHEEHVVHADEDDEDVAVETQVVVEDEDDESWLSPGRALVLPVGYLLLAGAIALVLVVMAYIIGYDRGDDTARKELADGGWMDQVPADGWSGGQDPLTLTDQPGGGVLGSPETGVTPVTPVPPAAAATSDPSGWGAIESDPRIRGFRYFVLAEPGRDGAFRLAEFCRANQLETYVVPSNNSRARRWVIALPGFDVPSSHPEVVALRDRIRQVGGRWKREMKGVTDLSDAYPLLYDP